MLIRSGHLQLAYRISSNGRIPDAQSRPQDRWLVVVLSLSGRSVNTQLTTSLGLPASNKSGAREMPDFGAPPAGSGIPWL
ncbi:MAG: hypothetical protein ACJ72H_28990 [Candidatus Sulfotelmatobacter sp.]